MSSVNLNTAFHILFKSPENKLIVPFIAFGAIFPYFSSLARGSCVDVIYRASHFAWNELANKEPIQSYIHLLGESLRDRYQEQMNVIIAHVVTDPLENMLFQGACWAFGFQANALLTDESLLRTAEKTVFFAIALFTISLFSGIGLLPLIGAYYKVQVTAWFINTTVRAYTYCQANRENYMQSISTSLTTFLTTSLTTSLTNAISQSLPPPNHTYLH